MKYIFHSEALEEYMEAVAYYADISAELAASFINAFERGIDQILTYPEACQTVEEDIRRHLTRRFPFGIYYTIEDDYILILAVMHMSRKPGYWKSRLKKEEGEEEI